MCFIDTPAESYQNPSGRVKNNFPFKFGEKWAEKEILKYC